MKYFLILTAFFLSSVNSLPKSKDEVNSTLSKHGSHYLFKLDSTEGGKRNSRCTPCGDDPGDRRDITNHLDPEYRGNGADNLGYDWSPRAWGGPAFTQRMRNQGMQYPMTGGWDRGRGGRMMTENWGRGGDPSQNIPFNCERCRMLADGNRYGNGFSQRMGRWQDDRRGYESEVATVTSPPIALRPEGRINYVPSPGGEMYWDGVSGGGTRWDGFSNGISWLGGNRPYDGSWRDDLRNRGYDQGLKIPDGYHDKGGPGNYRSWGNEPNRGPSWQPGKGYGDRWPGADQDMRYYGYASQWNYGTTNQNGWNGQNMKWGYGGKNWDNRDRNGYYVGNGGSPPRGKYDEDGNPLPHGSGGPPIGPSHSYGQGGSSYPYGQGSSSSPYGHGGSIQYGSGGSVYYDQGNYIFHYGNGGSPYDPSKYPQDGKPSPYPAGRPDYGQRPGLRPGGKPWDYNTNDRYDNREPAYSNINWIRPVPADGGYPKHDSHGKYPPGGYDDKRGRKPWLQRPGTGGYGPGKPEPGSGFPHGGTGYITGGVTHPGDRYPTGGYGGSRPSVYPGGSGHHGAGGGAYPGGPGGYPGSSGGTVYPGPSDGSGYPGSSGGNGYPGHGGSSGYTAPVGGSSYPTPTGGGGYPVPSGGNGYPPPAGGSGYPGPSGSSGYPAPSGGSGYPRPVGGNGFPGRPTGGSGYPGPGGGGSYPAPTGGSGYPVPSGGHPGSGGGSGYPSPAGGSGYPGSTGGSYPSSPGGSDYPRPTGGSRYPGSGGTGYPRPFGPSGGYGGGRPGDSGFPSPGDGGHDRPGGYGGPDRPGGPGPYPGPNRPPPKGHYTGFITELDPNKYPSNVNIGQGGNRYHGGGNYPIRDKDNYPNYDGNRYPGGGDRYPVGGSGDGYPGGGSGNPTSDRDRYYGGNRYPEFESDRYRPGTGDRFQPSGDGDDGNAWNYGQDGGHKDGIYRRAGGSYPPYRGGPFYTSSYLASASTPAVSGQSPSESKTQTVTKADEVTKPTPESA